MIENFYNYRDVVFVSRRFTRTRFNKSMIIFCGINSLGKNIIFAYCFLQKDDEDGYKYMMENFDKAFGQYPKIFVVEKHSPLKNALQKYFSNVRVLYCYSHYQRCIRHYFETAKAS